MNLKDELLYWIDDHCDAIAIAQKKDNELVELTYQKFVSDIISIAITYFEDEKDRYVIVGENSYQWMCQYYACMLAGKKTLLCDMLLPEKDMLEVFAVAEIEKVIFSEEMQDLEIGVKKTFPSVEVSYWSDTDYELIDKDDIVRKLEKFDKSSGASEMICLTSGTTSKAKAVVVDVDTFINNNHCLSKVLYVDKNDSVYSPLPMHHAYGINKTFTSFFKGARLCLGNMRTVKSDIAFFKPDKILVVPTVVEFLHKASGICNSIRGVIVSGAKCERRIEDICSEYCIFLQNIYGSSETGGGIALNLEGNHIDELTPISGRDIIIGSENEIIVRTPWIMKEYYKNPSATADKRIGNDLHTGDVGYIDGDGRLHITGRINNMIAMANGDKIYCEETDEILCNMDGVREAAVIYVDQKLVAVVCLDNKSKEESVREQIDKYNRGQQIIRRFSKVWIIKQLPRTSTGKLKRNELSEMYIMKNK